MESRAKIAGHPVHPMLVAFPLGLLGTAAIFDGIQKASGNERWSEAAQPPNSLSGRPAHEWEGNNLAGERLTA
jgi:hypothetical protein